MNGSMPFRFLFIGSRAVSGAERFGEVLGAALRGGIDAFLLREKEMDGGPLLRLAREAREATRKAEALLIVSDRIDVALAAGADGVHLPENSFDAAEARRIVGDEMLVGRSVHDREGAMRAEQNGADYLLVGPVFPTPGKEERALGIDRATAIVAGIRTPAAVVGGIDGENVGRLAGAGFSAAAVIRAVAAADNPEEKTRDLRSRIDMAFR